MFSHHKLTIAIGLILLSVIVGILLWILVTESNAQKLGAIGTVLGAIGAVGALGFIGYQAIQLKASIDLQIEAFNLEKRPYLHPSLENLNVWRRSKESEWCYGGGDLYFINPGNVPASIVNSEYMIATDEQGKIGIVEWFEKEYGEFPDIKSVFPGQRGVFVPLHPTIGKKPNLLYVGAVIAYTGTKPGLKYWYKFSRIYILKFRTCKTQTGEEKEIISISPHTPDYEWDRNTGSDAPILKEPDWKFYLSTGSIG
ncbi:hypothetical protein KA005_21790 [bacterium]|nr:hypothetical protein [bacterium]